MSADNLISATKKLPNGNPTPFPAMYWHADGSNYIANSAADVLPNTTPYHPDGTRVEPETTAELALPLTKDEVIEHLTAGGVKFKERWTHQRLYDLLLESIKNALVEAKIEFDAASTDAKALLEHFPK